MHDYILYEYCYRFLYVPVSNFINFKDELVKKKTQIIDYFSRLFQVRITKTMDLSDGSAKNRPKLIFYTHLSEHFLCSTRIKYHNWKKVIFDPYTAIIRGFMIGQCSPNFKIFFCPSTNSPSLVNTVFVQLDDWIA